MERAEEPRVKRGTYATGGLTPPTVLSLISWDVGPVQFQPTSLVPLGSFNLKSAAVRAGFISISRNLTKR